MSSPEVHVLRVLMTDPEAGRTVSEIVDVVPLSYMQAVAAIIKLEAEGTVVALDNEYRRYKIVTDEFQPREKGENHGT